MADASTSAQSPGRRRRMRLGPLLVVCLLGFGGCGRIERARECQALVAAVNPALDAIEARQDAGVDQRAALLDAARRYDRLAAEVTRLRFTNTEHRKSVREYADLLRQAAGTARGVAGALDQGNVGAITRARVEMASVVRKQKALSRRLNQMCQNP